MAMQGYGSAPGRRPQVASAAPRRAPKPKPLIAGAMKRNKANGKCKGS